MCPVLHHRHSGGDSGPRLDGREALEDLGQAKLLIGQGDGTNIAATPTGDVTITKAGAVTVGADKIDNTKLANIARGSVKVGGADNAPTDLDAKTLGQILVGDGTDIVATLIAVAIGKLANMEAKVDQSYINACFVQAG